MDQPRGWERYRSEVADQLIERTGHDLRHWNLRVRAEGPDDEAGLKAWLAGQGVTGYAASLLARERFGYPAWMTASAEQLIEDQYRDRPALRPVFDAVIAAATAAGEVAVQARKTYVSLLTPRRTFARVQMAGRTRVLLALRLDPSAAQGRLEPSKVHETTPVQVALGALADVDAEVLAWLQRAYDENA